MKGKIVFAAFLIITFIVGCGPSKTTYIEILEPDRIFYMGEIDFRVEPADTLKVVYSKTCKGGRGVCWEVRDMEKGKTGYVKKIRVEERP